MTQKEDQDHHEIIKAYGGFRLIEPREYSEVPESMELEWQSRPRSIWWNKKEPEQRKDKPNN